MKSDSNTYPGYKLKGLRIKNQYTLAETATNLDITTSYLSLIENGKKEPSKKVLTKASIFFNVPIDYFHINSDLIEELKRITSNAELDEIIHAFEIILKNNSN
ncbi:helix-turn-helix transcriptional regulator [Shewanella sp. S-1]|uniref:Helix-turn-helix transcriptional regulator n=1 Tax=Shewanella oncorhynchi TaxID=2726434 RepID=A0ABX1KJK4_9GAMM|nr:helix-turn-helix transcriptional regulator [Shewanella oncorhynchi]NLQ22372.1 helix-turn-helix transcriptional regulator [Shewanella oncorhynchi]